MTFIRCSCARGYSATHHDQCDGEEDPVPDLGVEVERRSASARSSRSPGLSQRLSVHTRHLGQSAIEQAELVSATVTLSWSWRERDARSVARASRPFHLASRARLQHPRQMSFFGNPPQNTGTPAPGTGAPSLFGGGGGAFGAPAAQTPGAGASAPSLFGGAAPAAGASSAFGGFSGGGEPPSSVHTVPHA
jgi:hypothetical protein